MEHKPFNYEHALAGARVGTISGEPVRIICWDASPDAAYRYDQRELFPILGLNTVLSHGLEIEIVVYYNKNGCRQGYNPTDSLVMLPLGFINGKPVYTGDEVMFKSRDAKDWSKYSINASCRLPDSYSYSWPITEYTLDGKNINQGDTFWFNYYPGPGSPASWKKVVVDGEKLKGADEKFWNNLSHLKENPGRYSWTEPEKYETWQARFKGNLGEYYATHVFTSKDKCKEYYGENPNFIRVDLIYKGYLKNNPNYSKVSPEYSESTMIEQ